jgi:hypothetical protein
MKFKQPKMEQEYLARPARLLEVCQYFEELSHGYGIEPVVTRVLDPVRGESGVHPQGRAVDFRNETRDADGNSHFLYGPEQSNEIVAKVSERFPRHDGKPTILHHSFNGAPWHFHLQVPVLEG